VATEAITKQAQRPAPRWPITSVRPVRADLGPAGAGQLMNISASGIRVKSVAPLRRDAEIPVRIDVPDRFEPLRCSGVVVWSKPDGAAGIRLTNLTDSQRHILNGWIAELEKVSGAPTLFEERDEFVSVAEQVKSGRMNNADALSLIVRRVTALTSAEGVAIVLGKPEHMVCLSATGIAPEIGAAIPPGVGLAGECTRTRKMVLCQNAATDPRAGSEPHFASAVIFPLLVNNDLRGMLQVYSAGACAFDPKSLEALEKLADAVIFVMYGIMPQRRLVIVAPAAIATKHGIFSPSDSGRWVLSTPSKIQPTTTQSSAPAATPATASTSVKPQLAHDATPTASPVTPAPKPAVIAEPVVTKAEPVLTMAEPIVTKSVTEIHEIREIQTQAATKVGLPSLAQPLSDIYEPVDNAGIWKVAIAAIVILVVIPVGYYVWHSPQSAAVAQTAPGGAVATSTSQPAPQVAAVVTPAPALSTPAASQKLAATRTASPSTASPSTETKSHSASETIVAEKKAPPIEFAPPQPAPIVLAAGHSVKPARTDDSEVAAPAALQMSYTITPSAPAIGLPASSSVPKLTAEIAKTWTGGTLIRRVAPVYPQTARSLDLQGQVELQVRIKADGSIDKVRVLKGHPILVRAATDAVRLWRYDPFRADGVPVEKDATIILNFTNPR